MYATGYTIPKGWAIMLVASAIQMNPNIYKDPLAFNPWRWKVNNNFFFIHALIDQIIRSTDFFFLALFCDLEWKKGP